jgi:hypothetical protein
MPSDKTRTSDDIRQGYKGPVMQQGRVILDRDFNALQETLSGATEADALDIIGPCGTPDDGFAIIIPGISSPPDPGLWVPPAPLVAPAPHAFDFLISPGTMYVGGQRALFPAADPGQQLFTYSYFDQPDWIQPDDPSGGSPPDSPQVEFVYLHLFEQEVSAVEDSDLKDVALGGPDTTQRLRLMRRVKRLSIEAGDCTSALAQAQADWLECGLQFDPPTMRLLPQAALEVSFSQSATASDPCDPVATGGYLGAENQLIRVQISDAGDGTAGSGKLLWGYDNASFLYRITINDDRKTLQLNQSPVDAFHTPRSGQVVEVLRTAAVLESDPNASDPSQTQTIVRCIAEGSGEVRTLATGYDPGTGTVSLDQNQLLPAEYLTETTPVFLRVWQAQLPFNPSPAGDTVELTDPVGQSATTDPVTTGLRVTITIPDKTPVGAYWMIAVRPSTPQAVYPERFLIAQQPPDGPRQWACPLAVIDWTKALGGSPPGDQLAVQDCREKFDNLVDLTKRRLGGCCTVQVRPEDLSAGKSLQDIIDQFKSPDRVVREVTICLMPGKYELTAPLVLERAHSNFTIEACHDGAVIEAAPGSEAAFLDGLFVLLYADNVVLRNLRFHLPLVAVGGSGLGFSGVSRKVLAASRLESVGDFTASIGVRALHSACLKLEGCLFRFSLGVNVEAEQPPITFPPIFAVGLHAGSECWGITVQNCRFLHHDSKALAAPNTGDTPPVLIGLAIMPQVVFGDSPNVRDVFTSGQFVSALLEDGVFEDNTFSGLSFAIMAVADMGMVRIERNIVRSCQNGFFLVSPDANAAFPLLPLVVPTALSPATPEIPRVGLVETMAAVAQNDLFQRARVLATTYPIPARFDLKPATKVKATEAEGQTVAIVEKIQNLVKSRTSGSKGDSAVSQKKQAAKSAKASKASKAEPIPPTSVRKIAAFVRNSFKVGPKFSAFAVADALIGRLARAALSGPRQPQLTLVLHVCGNEISVSQSAVLLGNLDVPTRDVTTLNPAGLSIVMGNHMEGTSLQALPAVLLGGINKCTVVGNIIVDSQRTYSLALLAAPSGFAIASIATGSPCTVTVKTALSGVQGSVFFATITGVNGGIFNDPTTGLPKSVNDSFFITVTGSTTFTVPVQCVTAPTDLTNAIVFVYSNFAPPVAVTGNVLQGASNLPLIGTGKPAPVDTWAYANTTI